MNARARATPKIVGGFSVRAWLPTRERAATKKASNKLQGEAAERAAVGVQRVPFPGEHDARERAGENEMAGFERHAQRAELVGEPGDAKRGMAENTRGDAGVLAAGMAVQDAPAQ